LATALKNAVIYLLIIGNKPPPESSSGISELGREPLLFQALSTIPVEEIHLFSLGDHDPAIS
jgi:hypothetical protein